MWFKDADAFLMLAEKFRQSMMAAKIAPKKSDQHIHRRQMDAYLDAGAIVLLERESKGGKSAFLNADPYARPMDIGGTDKSHHSVTLNRLVKRGLVERIEMPGPVRRSYRYTLTNAGKTLVRG